MTKTKLLLGSLGLCAALAAGGALAQTGSTVPGAMPPDTSAPSRDPSPPPDAANLGGNSGDKTGSRVTQHKHKKARKSTSPTPKPADNDNNATPNTPK